MGGGCTLVQEEYVNGATDMCFFLNMVNSDFGDGILTTGAMYK